MEHVAFDSHKKYTLAAVEPAGGGPDRVTRIEHGG